jgi:dipeptidyl aminopeptidase/acylaminoacyl peptidase
MTRGRSCVSASGALFALLTAVLAGPAGAQDVAGVTTAPVTAADYGRWETPGPAALSPDGRWLAYTVNRVDEENQLRVWSAAADSAIVLEYASGPSFSADGRWLAYAVGVSPAERDRLTRAREPVRNGVGLIELRTGASTVFDDVASFRFSADGAFIALRAYPPEGSRGADLVIRDVARGVDVNFGNVADYAWSPDGAVLAMTIATATGAGNAVQTWDAAAGTLRVLDSSGSLYRGLGWREDARDLAVLRARPDEGFRDTTHAVLAWTGVGSRAEARHELEPPADTLRVSETRTPSWSEDGRILLLGLRPRVRKVEADTSAPADPVSDVQVWHAADVRIIPQQKAQEQQDLRRTLAAVWHLEDGRLVRLGSDLERSVTLLPGWRHAAESDPGPYAEAVMFGRPWQDVWLIDTETGERRRALERVRQFYGPSATGRYLLWWDGAGYRSYDVATGTVRDLTAALDAAFANTEYDYPTDQAPPYGIAGWTTGDEAVLVYDRYDVWRIAADGSGGRRLTDGAADSVVHRLQRVSGQPGDDGVDLDRPVYFTLAAERTKQSGWARLRQGRVERVLLGDAALRRLVRADSTDTFAFTRERFDDAPDWFIAGASLADGRQVSRLNPFQSDFAWGCTELVDYALPDGTPLQGVLIHPAAYDPARRYPLIVYTYERLSQNLHNYVVPSERSYYNVNVFSAQGYFVLMPDIIYRGREPGPSALEAVEAAVTAALETGRIDADRIGLVGHSWGGYQATFIPTRTDLFAASVAGAPITNFLSFAGAIHWTPGIPEFSHWETGQARMDVPFWEDMDAYLRSSPAHAVHELRTPMLMMFGDADGTVDWHQGVEFYNFARRAGNRDFVMLVYPGEDHGLRKKENQIDYHRRILEWFGHWLKGEPAAPWMKDGVSWLERRTLLEGRQDGRRP